MTIWERAAVTETLHPFAILGRIGKAGTRQYLKYTTPGRQLLETVTRPAVETMPALTQIGILRGLRR